MGAPDASFLVLADAVSTAQSFVDVFVGVYILVILVYVVTSLVGVPYSLSWLRRFLDDVCEPYLRLFRRFLPSLGPFDLSPMAAVIVLVALDRIVIAVLGRLN